MPEENADIHQPPDPFPALPGTRVVSHDHTELMDFLAKDIAWTAHRRVRETGCFHLALSGGSTPQPLYRSLMIDPRYRLLPWRSTHLWVVDERCVPLTDERSNYRMLREWIVDHSDIPDAQVHPMPATEPYGAERYETELRSSLDKTGAGGRLDYILLGMGADGHTASLFPNTPALDETTRWVLVNDGDSIAVPRPRMTMTYPLLNAARRIAILITGTNKHPTLRNAAATSETPDAQPLPITGIRPTDPEAELIWYLDAQAATGKESPLET